MTASLTRRTRWALGSAVALAALF
ncbi:DUF305 domain-containing protein, partial [Streptomyces sp. FT05W]